MGKSALPDICICMILEGAQCPRLVRVYKANQKCLCYNLYVTLPVLLRICPNLKENFWLAYIVTDVDNSGKFVSITFVNVCIAFPNVSVTIPIVLI